VAACNGNTVRLSQAAADDALRAVGRTGQEVALGQDDLSRLTAKYNIQEEAVRQAAPSVQSSPAWVSVQKRTSEIVEAAAEDETGVVSAAVGVACDGLTGQIKTPQQMSQSLASAVEGMAPNRAFVLQQATRRLEAELAQIALDGSEDDKATALLFCYTLGAVY
jgi:HAMP domain-containing protein